MNVWEFLKSFFDKVGDIVLDPFVGSGSSLCAAKMLCRHFIGIEIDRKYLEIANSRIESI